MAHREKFWSLAIKDDQDRTHTVPEDVISSDPLIRGYWVDEEVMEIARIESSSIIMKMKWADAVRPSHIAIKPKGRKRAWSARNVLRALLTAELARLGRMSFLAAAKIIGSSHVNHLDRLMNIDGMLLAIAERVQDESVGNMWFAPDVIENPAKDCAIIIEDWSLVSWFTKGEEFQPLAKIVALEKKDPEIRGHYTRQEHFKARVTLTIPVEPVIERFLNALAVKKQGMG